MEFTAEPAAELTAEPIAKPAAEPIVEVKAKLKLNLAASCTFWGPFGFG